MSISLFLHIRFCVALSFSPFKNQKHKLNLMFFIAMYKLQHDKGDPCTDSIRLADWRPQQNPLWIKYLCSLDMKGSDYLEIAPPRTRSHPTHRRGGMCKQCHEQTGSSKKKTQTTRGRLCTSLCQTESGDVSIKAELLWL